MPSFQKVKSVDSAVHAISQTALATADVRHTFISSGSIGKEDKQICQEMAWTSTVLDNSGPHLQTSKAETASESV